jgi:sulfopyruvate decarboxylase alpha subunit
MPAEKIRQTSEHDAPHHARRQWFAERRRPVRGSTRFTSGAYDIQSRGSGAGSPGPGNAGCPTSLWLATSPTTRPRPRKVTANGQGFSPKILVQLTWDGSTTGMPTAVTNGRGVLRITFNVPKTTIGPHTSGAQQMLTATSSPQASSKGAGDKQVLATTEGSLLATAEFDVTVVSYPTPAPTAPPSTPDPTQAPTSVPTPSPDPTATPKPTATGKPVCACGGHTAGVRQVAMVPDAGHSRLIRSFEADPDTRVVTLTTEEEGVAMLAGAWLGGERGVLLLQSSGVGNCINMLSLPVICHMPLLMIVTMRGDWGEFNPWQIPMGQGTRPSLEAMGVIVNKVDEPDLVASTVQGAAHLAFNTWKPVAVLLGQRVLGAKNFKELARK